VRPSDVDESLRAGEEPADYVLRLALEKAAAGARDGELVLGADTTVVLDGEVLGKPLDAADARAMLGRIAGREHVVFTGVALHDGTSGRRVSAVDTTRVRMAPLTEAQIAWYVATGEPMDKAGAYGIQGKGALFVDQVFGNYGNVVGLPLPMVRRLMAEIGLPIDGYLRPRSPARTADRRG
jgi:septum formation protein